MSGVGLKALPPEEAIAYFRQKGLAPRDLRFDWRDIWQAQHASEFTVAKAMDDNIVEMLRADVLKAMREGRGFSGWSLDLPARLEAAGWWGRQEMLDPLTGEVDEVQLGSLRRLRTIFDTNMRTALAVGRWAQIQRTKAFFPYLGYRQIDRPTKRPAHAIYDGLVRPVDDPIWLRIFPPNGFYCGCTVFQITARQIRNGEYKVSPPLEIEEAEWENERRGETEYHPRGVHPGFDFNPGAVWLDTEARMEEMAGPENFPAVVGAAAQARLDGLRDGYERGVALDEAGNVVWSATASPDRPDALSLQHAPPPGSDFVHNHPREGFLSVPDLVVLSEYRLKTITAITPGGGVFSVHTAEGGYLRHHAAMRDFREGLSHDFAQAYFVRFAAQPPRARPLSYEGRLLEAHLAALWLEKKEVLHYFHNMTGH